MTASDLIAAAARRLAAAGVASPRVDAELLLAEVLRVPRSSAALQASVADSQLRRYAVLVSRRVAREPLQHILGTAPFRYVEPAVGTGVFVPRPETELLVDAVLPHLRGVAAPLVVDLCAGSGALALAVADEVPDAQVIAVECASAALTWLRRNAAGKGVEVVAADVRDPHLLSTVRGRVDAVLCNPPYVPSATEVEPEVRADPLDAVFAGPDGLRLMPPVLCRAGELLRPGGVFVLEHSETHADEVLALLAADGRWDEVADHLDLAGRPRFATARRASRPHTAN